MTRYTPLYMQEGSYAALQDRWVINDIFGAQGAVLLSGAGAFAVSQHAAGANMSVDVAPGRALVPGTDVANQGAYSIWSDAIENPSIATAPGAGQSRIDLIVADIRDDFVIGGGNNDFIVFAVTGTPAATGSQVAPTLPPSAVALAQVLVGPNVTSIVTANITDVRPFPIGAFRMQTLVAPTVASSPYTINHKLNTTTPIVQIWDTVTSQLVLAQVTVLDANNVQISVSANMPNNVNVIVAGMAAAPLPQLASDLTTKSYVDARTPNLPAPLTSGSTIQSFVDALGDVWVAKNGVGASPGNWYRARDVIHAIVSRSGTAAQPTVLTQYTFDIVTRDAYGLLASSALIPPVAGWYMVSARCQCTATATAQWLSCQLRQSGSTVGAQTAFASAAGSIIAAVAMPLYLNTSDNVQLWTYASSALATVVGVSNQMLAMDYLGTGP